MLPPSVTCEFASAGKKTVADVFAGTVTFKEKEAELLAQSVLIFPYTEWYSPLA